MGRRILICAVVVSVLAGALARVASAEFPYGPASDNKKDYSSLRTGTPGQVPNDLNPDDWRFLATPEQNNFPVNQDARELNGIRGGWVADPSGAADKTAWQVTTGRPDVVIAVMDSGIEWNNDGVASEMRFKIRLNRGELPVPNHSGPDLVGGVNCSTYKNADDANDDGVFNLLDYACDSRLGKNVPKSVGPTNLLDAQDALIAFSDGKDDDGNDFVDDIAGWDFLDDDNDPFDDVQYGHGSGEIRGSTAEANNGGGTPGFCPNCMGIPLRVGDSFVADDNRFGQAAIYAVDNGVSVIQEALGTLNDTALGQKAIDYAYDHGVVTIASAADEAAQHHNYPSAHAHPIVVNSVTRYMSEGTPNPLPDADVVLQSPRSYLSFNGCTNFMSKLTLAIPSTSCSSNATEVGAGMAGLVYSAAMNAIDHGRLQPHPRCRRVDGSACPITANEVRQTMASGSFDGQTQPDDVNFLRNALTGDPQAEPNCAAKDAGCTDPNGALQQMVDLNRPVVSPPASRSYPARFGHDQFYGYGRVNTWRATQRVSDGYVPPEVEITSPDWYTQVDPGAPTADLKAQVHARGAPYSCKVYVAPGSYPNNHLTTDPLQGDFKQVPSPVCDGTNRTDPIDGTVAALDVNDLKSRFPADAGDFRGVESGAGAGQTSNGRPNSEPYGFTVRVVARSTTGSPAAAATGEDQRNLYLHRDRSMLPGFPKKLTGDGESSPAFADLNRDNHNELIFGTADGRVHAMRPDGSELPGWPVRTDRLPLHTGGRAFASGAISETTSLGAILGAVAIADLDRDGSPEVIAGDNEGKLYVWTSAGKLLWKREANPAYSGKPLKPFENVRDGKPNRTQHGFIASPVAADLEGDDNGRLEVIAAGMDRHVYAFQDDGASVPGYPVLVVDTSKVSSVDATTHRVKFTSDVDFNQGAIVDTPAVGDITGDARPEIVIGTNEEYHHNSGNEGGPNASGANGAAVRLLGETAGRGDVLANANTRLFAIKPEGERDGKPNTADWQVAGWPVKMTLLMKELLPVVGEGVSGPPVLAPIQCSSGDDDKLTAGAYGNTGVGYLINGDGSSCLGNGPDGAFNVTDTNGGANSDKPVFPAVGGPAFGDFAGGVSFIGGTAGLKRALDLVLTEYQMGGQDSIAVWNPSDGTFRSGFPAHMNDLQFLTGPAVADIDGQAGEELLNGSAYLDLAAYDGSGARVAGYPKLSSDWMVATPLIGSFGTDDSDPAARKVVVSETRNGTVFGYSTTAPACSPGSWPRYHHDLANSGDYTRDAVLPGRITDVDLFAAGITIRAPGDDTMCGKVARYEVVQSDRALTGATFEEGDPIPVTIAASDIVAPGKTQGIGLLTGALAQYVSIRAVDDKGNVGPVTTINLKTTPLQPGTPPELEAAAAALAKCADVKPPLTSIHSKVGYSRKTRKLVLSGRTADRGCRDLKSLNNLVTTISIERREGKRCRFLGSDNKLTARRKCNRPIKLRVRGKYSLKKLKLEWSYKTKAKLPRGRYVIRATGSDQSGNREKRESKKNVRPFTVR
jgi:hypothetical protein